MRTPFLAILLPLCLTACLDTTPTETEEAPASPVKVTPKPAPEKQLENKNIPSRTEIEKLEKTNLKNVSLNDIKTTKSELNTLITDTQCDTNTQCKVSPVGSRACGGPSSYIVYSTKTTTEKEVSALSKKITMLESNYNEQKGMMSTCQHLTAPSTQCVENKCVKLESSAVSAF
ncbi:hypothetical protein I6F65_13855 [Pseudoalteromonas sp. SWXJZ94C]|uniref:hypothetical protein n=1 Tax=unclassified Pseudoalteromonas TaxID=194690 RepID=UPI00140DA4CD|nr:MULTISPECIES: hypothetical protein [unclassified Pseudoalteromonas]MBH0058045.1 hypothetical protein [Pseudoalteromonas sp. SWXJZ94C]